MATTPAWPTFSERLTQELAVIEARFKALLSASSIMNVDPNRYGGGLLGHGRRRVGLASRPKLDR
ncbi:MAG TPA: hypothetical protein VK988_11120 [Acidimicrobiales bacterium]|nr:hypothetical protein [Acidimicrobiales bacterium]